ncbi:hypothetical protein ACFORO_42640 [Amycolatopsis halotolerans]|uniref:Uncharacterized protein n=1 Tax=Amycolatopsis halotolerans TaxID=330083 RepID=A0ABV7QXK1_9PSEU
MSEGEWDPFKNPGQPRPASEEPPARDVPVDDQKEGGPELAELPNGNVKVTFKATGGYEAPWVVAEGTAGYLAGLFAIESFDGKISTLMKQAIAIDAYYKKQYVKAAETNPKA